MSDGKGRGWSRKIRRECDIEDARVPGFEEHDVQEMEKGVLWILSDPCKYRHEYS